MLCKKCAAVRPELWLAFGLVSFLGRPVVAQMTPAAGMPTATVTGALAQHKIKAVDADNHTIVLNRVGYITMIVGTNEDSQDGARAAGKAMYPFQGRPDFRLIVVVDLRGSVAAWVPSLVIDRMKASLDEEAVELKPYFLANGNKGNPRNESHVVPDFNGAVCPQLNWPEGTSNLRGILFGADGREIKRWDDLTDMNALQADVRTALQALIDVKTARNADANKARATKPLQFPAPSPLQAAPAPGN
jgi:hypothetical protein